MMRRIDRELGLPTHISRRIKAELEVLEDKDEKLEQKLLSLESESDSLKQRIAEIESGGLGIRKVSDEAGERVEFAPSDRFIMQLTSDGVLKPIEPNILRIGDQENYLNDVITANITIPSLPRSKENVEDLDPSLLDIELPAPKIYERSEGRREKEIGFMVDELPEILRRGDGYDLKALVAILAWKIQRLEKLLAKATQPDS